MKHHKHRRTAGESQRTSNVPKAGFPAALYEAGLGHMLTKRAIADTVIDSFDD
jgi:hypothetical protein